MAETPKVWFITGASRGFGRVWAAAALERGDLVAATARDVGALADLVEQHPDRLLPIRLDVTDRAAVLDAVAATRTRFGRIDVVVANAGFGLFGAVEEVAEAAARRQFEVNVFGVLWVLQAAAPILRAQGGGRVLLTSSFGGLISFGTAGLYGASKYALEGLGESFALELRDAGVAVTLLEPAAYSTGFSGPSAEQADPIAAYDGVRARTGEVFAAMPPGDPQHTADAVLRLVDMAEPPRRMLLGAHVLPLVLDAYAARIEEWRRGRAMSEGAQ